MGGNNGKRILTESLRKKYINCLESDELPYGTGLRSAPPAAILPETETEFRPGTGLPPPLPVRQGISRPRRFLQVALCSQILYLLLVIKTISVMDEIQFVDEIRADIQRESYILAWTVILSVYGADTIAIDLSLSALIS
jgi:hypothetical protein